MEFYPSTSSTYVIILSYILFLMHNSTFMINSMINIPRNIASVEIKNVGMEIRREVVSMAIVMQLRRMVPIIMPLKSVVYI